MTASPDVWQVLRDQFALSHEIYQPEVKKQMKWLISHPEYIQKLAKQSEPYIYHILNEIKARHLPGELAIIPMIESAYDPFAYSSAGAAGLWQLMPGTGSGLGLKQDWWFDGRRSIDLSTKAALSYLQYLHKYFKGNWNLAIAAYDSGEGKIGKAIRATGRTRSNAKFWSLNVPRETKAYIPRLLAMAEIIKHAKRYHISLPQIPWQPYFENVNIGSQIDLNHAAKMAQLPYKELIKLNPGFNRWASAPDKPYYLNVPKEKVELFLQNLEKLPKEKRVSWQRHQVKKGETLNTIAIKYHTTTYLIKQVNSLKTNKPKLNQFILIPQNSYSELQSKHRLRFNKIDTSTSSKFKRVIHIVQPGDNYSLLETRYGVTMAQIRFWNNVTSIKSMTPGTQLIIWKRIGMAGTYNIQKGDTLSAIAKKHHTTVKALLTLNQSIRHDLIKPGQKIKIT